MVHRLRYQSPWLRILVFLAILCLMWLPLAIPVSLFLQSDRNLVTIITMTVLFVDFLLLQKLWGNYVLQDRRIFTKYGLSINRTNIIELISGLVIGVSFCWSLFIFEAIFGWVKIHHLSIDLWKIILEGLISALGIGLGEELVFRGWILQELEQDYPKNKSIFFNSLLFAIAHFIKPLTEIIRTFVNFPAYIILGYTLVWAKRNKRDRLGICIGLHGGLVWGYYVLNVGELIDYTNKVPDWVTGIDGNPIAGVFGLLFLSLLAIMMRNNFFKQIKY